MADLDKNMFFKNRFIFRLAFFLAADVVFISLSAFLAFFVRFEGIIPAKYDLNILGVIFLASLITIPVFYFSKLYHFTWLYVSTGELISLIRATAVSFLILTASFLFLREHPVFTGFPRSTLFITYFFIFIFAGGIRFAKRVSVQLFSKGGKERTLIVGAGRAGEQMLRSMVNSLDNIYRPVGFVDDDPTKKGILIHGYKVLGRIEDIPELVKKHKVEGLIIALPSVGSETKKEAVEAGRKAGLQKIKIIPAIEDVISGKARVGVDMLQDLEMEKLLSREPAVLDKKLIESFIRNKKVMITGAAGSIGSELSRQISKFNPSALLVLDQDETGIFNISGELKEDFPELKLVSLIADVRDEKKIGRIFSYYFPEIVFHAAAYKHVPLMEEYPEEAVKNNIFGTLNLASNSLNNKTDKFVFISTDKAVNPSSVMGATKRAGEMICQALSQKNSTKFISVRFGNVLGSRGSVIPVFKEQIKRGGPIKITHSEMKRYFMTTPEACLLVMEAGAMGQGGEVFVLDMGDPVKIIDLARDLIKLSGLEPDKDIPIVFTDPRPGEKFFEEILSAEEGTVKTKNQKIFMAKLSETKEDMIIRITEELREEAKNGEKGEIIKSLKKLIPTFQSAGY